MIAVALPFSSFASPLGCNYISPTRDLLPSAYVRLVITKRWSLFPETYSQVHCNPGLLKSIDRRFLDWTPLVFHHHELGVPFLLSGLPPRDLVIHGAGPHPELSPPADNPRLSPRLAIRRPFANEAFTQHACCPGKSPSACFSRFFAYQA